MNISQFKPIAKPDYFNLFAGGNPQQIGLWTAIATEDVHKDWNYYSKAHHRKYGPKVTVSNRQVTFTSSAGLMRVVEFDGWRGNWQLRALLAAKIVKPKAGLMHVRLNPAFGVKLIHTRLGYKFYLRTIKDIPYDYCIVSPLGMTYHDRSIPECLAGLRRKQVRVERRKTAFVDWHYLIGLGFCRSGIREFCSTFGFSINSTVTPQEIYDRVEENPRTAAPFIGELKTLAKAVCFEVAEWVQLDL